MNKKIMIIGAGDFQVPLIEYAASKYDVVLVAPVISDYLKSLAGSCYELDVREKEKILEIAQEEKIDGVITDQTDIPVRTVAYVAEKMGLPGIGYETSMLFTDKALMSAKLAELGIRVIPSKPTTSVEEAVSFLNEIKSDVLIKPTDSQGSRGIYVCGTEEDLVKSYEKAASFSTTGTVLVQKFIRGREFFAEGLAFKGEFTNLIIGDTIYFDDNRLFAAKNRIVPSDAPSEMVSAVAEMNRKIITGFGLTQGITHSEFIVDEDGPYLIETAARGGGVFISSDLISLSTGLETERFLTDIALGQQKAFPELESGKIECGELESGKSVCAYMAFFIPKGEVVSADGVSDVIDLPYVHRHQLSKIKAGMKQGSDPSDKTSRFALIVSADTRAELEDRMNGIKEMMKIKVKTDHGEEGPVWE